jgi:protein TonB
VGKDKDVYVNTLLTDVFGVTQFAFANTFFLHPLNRRIKMIHSLQSNQGKMGLRVAKIVTGSCAAIMLVTIMYLQSCVKKQADSTGAKNTTGFSYMVWCKDPKNPKGEYDLSKFLTEHIKYPESMKCKGISGKVLVKFIIDENGNITFPEIMKSPDTAFSEEVLRVVKLMPPFNIQYADNKPTKIEFLLPVLFSLENDTPGSKNRGSVLSSVKMLDPNGEMVIRYNSPRLTPLENDTMTMLSQKSVKDGSLQGEDAITFERLNHYMNGDLYIPNPQ